MVSSVPFPFNRLTRTIWLPQVLIRTRPLSGTEVVSQGFSKCLKQESAHTLTWLGPPETRFTFDHVAGEVISQVRMRQGLFETRRMYVDLK
jgi:hypothetical protein